MQKDRQLLMLDFNQMGKTANSTQKYRRNKQKKHKAKIGCDLLVIRIDRNGNLQNSKPCSECVQLLKQHCINRVYYSNSLGEIVCEKVCQMATTYLSAGRIAINNLQKYGSFSCHPCVDNK